MSRNTQGQSIVALDRPAAVSNAKQKPTVETHKFFVEDGPNLDTVYVYMYNMEGQKRYLSARGSNAGDAIWFVGNQGIYEEWEFNCWDSPNPCCAPYWPN